MAGLESWLAISGLIAFPVLVWIYWARRERVGTHPFGAMRFLTLAIERTRRRLMIENILEFLLRALIIGAVVFFFARPYRWKEEGTRSGPVADIHLYVLDCSMSMAQNGWFDRAVSLALEEIESLDPSASAGLVLWSESAELRVPITTAKHKVTEVLRSTEMKASLSDGFALEKLVREVLSERPEGAWRIVFITDLQKSTFTPTALSSLQTWPGRSVQLNLISPDLSYPTENIAIHSASLKVSERLSDQLWEYELHVTIENFSDRAADAELSVRVGEDTIGRKRISLVANGVANATERFQWVPIREAQTGVVSIEANRADALKVDSEFPIVLTPPTMVEAAVLSEPKSEPFGSDHLFRAIQAADPDGSHAVRWRVFSEWSQVRSELSRLDWLIVDGLSLASLRSRGELEAIVKAPSAPRIWLSLASDGDPWSMNDFFLPFGFRVLSYKKGPPLTLPLSAILPDHQSATHATIREYVTVQLTDPSKLARVVSFENDQPYLVESGPLIFIASSLSGVSTNLAFQSAFISFLYRELRGESDLPVRIDPVRPDRTVGLSPRAVRRVNGHYERTEFPAVEFDLRRIDPPSIPPIDREESSRVPHSLLPIALALLIALVFAEGVLQLVRLLPLRTGGSAFLLTVFISGSAYGFGSDASFSVALLSHGSMTGESRRASINELFRLIRLRSNIEPRLVREPVKLLDPELFELPLIIATSSQPLSPLLPAESDRLARYLSAGGTLVVNDESAVAPSKLGHSVRSWLTPYPARQPILPGHPLFQAFYLLKSFVGRREIPSAVEGVGIDGRTAIYLTMNDVLGCLEKDEWGRPVRSMASESERRLCFRSGLNLFYTILTQDYKKEQVHIDFISRRRQF